MKKNVIAFIVILFNNSAASLQLPEVFSDFKFTINFSNTFVSLTCVPFSGSGFALNPGYGKIVSDDYMDAILISETHLFEFPFNPENSQSTFSSGYSG